MDRAAESDDNASVDVERLLITTLFGLASVSVAASVGAVAFLIRDSVLTNCGDMSAGGSCAIGKFGSDCGAASMLCTDMLRVEIPLNGFLPGESTMARLLPRR